MPAFAAYLARGTEEKSSPAAEPVAQLPTAEILVAKSDIGLGQAVKPEDLQWQTWPASAGNNLVNRASRAEAIKEIAGSIARAPFIAGEPIREQKLVRANWLRLHGSHPADRHAGALNRDLAVESVPAASSCPTTASTSSFPNARRNLDGKGPDVVQSEIILSNIRVLAIDQAPKEKEGLQQPSSAAPPRSN